MSGVSVYKQNSVISQSPGQLVVMLYDGAIKFLGQAVHAIEIGDMAKKGECVGRALDIINELDAVLDMEAGGEIALNLRKLYDFMRRHVIRGHANGDKQILQDVISLLEDLNESWRAISG